MKFPIGYSYHYLQIGLALLSQFCYAAIYTNTWAVHIEGGQEVAKDLGIKHGFEYVDQIMPDYYMFHHKHVSKRSTYANSHHHQNLSNEKKVLWLEQQVVKSRKKRDVPHVHLNDPKWPRMWYLNRGDSKDMNVIPAWRKGYTGKDVVVTILDDGIEKNHPDLQSNYDAGASFDVNGHDPDPQPRYDYSNENRHGTRCAGEVAAMAGNGICSVGVAYEAKIGGVRMLDGDVTDAVEAQSLSLNPQHIDIYSASWGPDDDGRTVDGPAVLARKAFFDGITKGRNGKGSIFIWASGNGGRDHDSCNCDGYTNSIYTLSISSATENGHIPWYSEACSSTLTTTYSSGSGGERQIVTTDLRKGCTETHTGTSASAPLAAGICALALQANRRLTWRDMQHIVVMTARPANLVASDWVTNGVGRRVSHSFGYGLMDAAAMAELAKNWTSVPTQHRCVLRSHERPRNVPPNQKIETTISSDGCKNTRSAVRYLEHVQAIVTLTSTRRGELEIFLTSPQGTRSTLLARRIRDTSTEGFTDWAFMTTHSWGEFSTGTWTLEVKNGGSSTTLRNWSLALHGTATHPQDPQARPKPPQPHYDYEDCKKGQYFLNNFCFDVCPKHYYADEVTMASSKLSVHNKTQNISVSLCQPCDITCSQCSGPAENDCLQCPNGLHLINSTCQYKEGSTFYVYLLQHQDVAFVLMAVFFCLIAVFLFVTLFCFLQAKDYGYCCFNGPYRAVRTDDPKVMFCKTEEKLSDAVPELVGQEKGLLEDGSESDVEEDNYNMEKL